MQSFNIQLIEMFQKKLFGKSAVRNYKLNAHVLFQNGFYIVDLDIVNIRICTAASSAGSDHVK